MWYRDPRWITGSTARGDFYADLAALQPEVRERVGARWESLTFLFGIGNGHPALDIALGEGDEFSFYRKELMRHAYLVGVDGGGNNYVQVTRGTNAGRVYCLDHEMYYGGLSPFVDFDGLDERERADLPWISFAEAETDDVVAKAVEFGFLLPCTDDFATFHEREVAAARALMEALAPKYLRG